MDTKKVLATHIILKNTQTRDKSIPLNTISDGMQMKLDTEYFEKEVIIIGTELQQYRLISYLSKISNFQIKDSFNYKINQDHIDKYKNNKYNPYMIDLLTL